LAVKKQLPLLVRHCLHDPIRLAVLSQYRLVTDRWTDTGR